MTGYDLHVHTNRSDGTFTPTEAVDLAVERGLTGIAITDHDTLAGLDEAASAAGDRIEIVPGIEFSAEYEGASLHVLAYWIDPANEALRTELTRLTDTRFRRGELMVEKLQELGYPIDFDRVREIAGGDTIARPHVAQAMVEAGIVPNEKAAFTEEFIADGGRAWVPKHALHPLDALTLIGQAGGVCVLAHPGMWKGAGSVPDDLIEAMAEGGMAGLEVDHPDHDETQRAKYREMATRLGLVPTGASDCHGRRYDPVRLGSETTSAERFAELRARAVGLTGGPVGDGVLRHRGRDVRRHDLRAGDPHGVARPGRELHRWGVRRRVSRGARRAVRFVPRAVGSPVPRTRRRHGRVGGGGIQALGIPARGAARRRPSVPGGARRPIPRGDHREPTERGEGRDPSRRAGRVLRGVGGLGRRRAGEA